MSKAKKFVQRRHRVSFTALRDSIREHGQHTPVFRLGGVIVDGKRRDRIMRELGRTPETVDLPNHKAAARVLWMHHPVAAFREFEGHKLTLNEAAELFGVRKSDVAEVRQLLRPSKSDKGELGRWRANYKTRWNRAQRYLSRVRQGLEPLTLGGIERALKLEPFNKGD